MKRQPRQFDADTHVTEQLWAISKDGTRVPYFLVRPKDIVYDGRTPTLMRGYGSTGGIMLPRYGGVLGRLWFEQGGAYVEAGIRGGGEVGPDWHVTGVGRRHTYEDFIAIAEDLIRRKITSPAHLGMRGHSMGGHLMGVILHMAPDLFNAAIVEHPQDLALLHPLSAAWANRGGVEMGSLWVPDERAFLEQTSPFQNLRKRPNFPDPLILVATNDGLGFVRGARRYAAKLSSLDMPYFYHEASEGGHGWYTTPQVFARHEALVYTYLAESLMESSRSRSGH